MNLSSNQKSLAVSVLVSLAMFVAALLGFELRTMATPVAPSGGVGVESVGPNVTSFKGLAVQNAATFNGAAAFNSTAAFSGASAFSSFLVFSPASTTISVTNGAAFTPTASYQPIQSGGSVTPTLSVTTTAGVAYPTGTLLRLTNTSATSILLVDTGTLKLAGNVTLGQFDSLALIFDGTNWIETARADN